MNAPFSPSVFEGRLSRSGDPFIFSTRLPPGPIAVRLCVDPNMRTSASRTPTVAVTPGVARMGFSVATGIGSKLFWAVTA